MWRGRGQVSGCLSSPVLLGMAAGRALCVYDLECHVTGLWASFPTQCCMLRCLLSLLLTSAAISTALGYCEDLLVTDLGIAATGPSPKQVRQKKDGYGSEPL